MRSLKVAIPTMLTLATLAVALGSATRTLAYVPQPLPTIGVRATIVKPSPTPPAFNGNVSVVFTPLPTDPPGKVTRADYIR